MSIALANAYRTGDIHRFDAVGHDFIYLASAGAIFALDNAVGSVLGLLRGEGMEHGALVGALEGKGVGRADAEDLLRELRLARVIVPDQPSARQAPEAPPADYPLQALVLNVTNQCNLACTYCYEFGADKIATPTGKPKYMSYDTAKAAVDLLLARAAPGKAVHLTFFGGETLMNFRLLRDIVAYARGAAAAQERGVTFSLTTNATLLTDEIIEFLADNAVGVTVSMDGPAELQDKRRVYKTGRGSYAVIEPKLRKLIARHRSRAITARVTLSAGVTDVVRIFRHLKDDIGFHEVGFAPVTTSGEHEWSLDGDGMAEVLEQFKLLANEWLEFAMRGQMHGFSNVSETISELAQGTNKSHPCGAGLGLLGVSPSGDLSPCHRFTDSDTHVLGHVSTGVDRTKQEAFLVRGHVGAKYECQSCWARPLCAGGCHHEAFVRYGDTGHANLHYCDWIRLWTDTCLRINGALAVANPGFLERFTERKGLS
jgi:uncharacterized protein